jgi:hypothetical protein
MFDPAVLGHRNANGFVHNIGTLNDRLLTLRAQAILKAEVPASTTNEARRLESFLDDKQLRFAAYDRRQRRRRAADRVSRHGLVNEVDGKITFMCGSEFLFDHLGLMEHLCGACTAGIGSEFANKPRFQVRVQMIFERGKNFAMTTKHKAVELVLLEQRERSVSDALKMLMDCRVETALDLALLAPALSALLRPARDIAEQFLVLENFAHVDFVELSVHTVHERRTEAALLVENHAQRSHVRRVFRDENIAHHPRQRIRLPEFFARAREHRERFVMAREDVALRERLDLFDVPLQRLALLVRTAFTLQTVPRRLQQVFHADFQRLRRRLRAVEIEITTRYQKATVLELQ